MNADFVKKHLKINDTVRVTTKEAVGVIGVILEIDVSNNGIVLGYVDNKYLDKIENAVDYTTALFPIDEILYIFTLDLTKS